MRIVSNSTEKDIAAHRAEEDALCRLKELAGELMRMVRGAGKPYLVEELAGAFLEAAEAYRETACHELSTDRTSAALRVRRKPLEEHPVIRAGEYAQEMAISGALQVAASRLLNFSAHSAPHRLNIRATD